MAEAALDMSLDDIIKKNKSSAGARSRGRGRGRPAGLGPMRRPNNRPAIRSAPYTKAPEAAWSHNMFATDLAMVNSGLVGGRANSIETGTKLYISNLDYGVSNEDIKELFSEVGDIKRYNVHYDKSGRSKGTAEVVFSRRQEALAAVKRYNNVQLDGKPMKIEIVRANIGTPGAGHPPLNGAFGGVPRSGQGRDGGFRRPRGSGGRGRGRVGGRGRGRGRGEKVSADDLDADLEKYHSEAMQTN